MGCASQSGVLIQDAEDFHQQYVLCEKLGKGNFGQVRACEHVDSFDSFAVKILDVRPKKETSYLVGLAFRSLHPEARTLRRRARIEGNLWWRIGTHKHCVRLYEVFMDELLCYFVMERCLTSVVKALEEMRPYPVETDVLRIIYEILLALQHVHSRKVVHRDVKPDNFLFGVDKGRTTKLADFGLSSLLGANRHLKAIVGTPPYMSPEMLRDRCYEFKTDVWSLGVSAYVMLFGRFPYETDLSTSTSMKVAIASGCPHPSYRPFGSHPVPSSLAEVLVRNMLVRDARRRASATRTLESARGRDLATIVAFQSENVDSTSFLPVVLESKRHIGEFLFPPEDPTVQHSIDQVLDLMRQHKSRARSFTDPMASLCSSTSSGSSSTSRRFHTVCSPSLSSSSEFSAIFPFSDEPPRSQGGEKRRSCPDSMEMVLSRMKEVPIPGSCNSSASDQTRKSAPTLLEHSRSSAARKLRG